MQLSKWWLAGWDGSTKCRVYRSERTKAKSGHGLGGDFRAAFCTHGRWSAGWTERRLQKFEFKRAIRNILRAFV